MEGMTVIVGHSEPDATATAVVNRTKLALWRLGSAEPCERFVGPVDIVQKHVFYDWWYRLHRHRRIGTARGL